MFSFDSIYGFVNLDPKKLITTQDVDAAFSRDGCRVIIFFLYGRSNETNTYPDEFSSAFGDINYLTDQDIDFWTYYSSPNYDKLPDYQVEAGLKQLEISESAATRRRDNNNRKEENNGYQNMRLLAQLFNVDIVCAPCFVLLDPISHTVLNLGFNKNLSPITQVRIIIEIIKDKQFDWDEISTYYHTPYSRLSYDGGEELQEILKKHYQLEKYGFRIDELCDYGFSEPYIVDYAMRKNWSIQDGYVSLKHFLFNYEELCNGKQDLIDKTGDICRKYIELLKFKTKQDVPYLEIHDYLEKESYSNLYYAQNIVHDRESDETCSKYSLACFCIGKLLETEINLGYVQKIRQELGISMPDKYNQWAGHYDALVSVLSNNRSDEINYNKRKRDEDNALRYPNISKTRELLFEGQDIVGDENGKKMIAFRERLQKTVFNGTLKEVGTSLNTIFRNRNKAMHGKLNIKKKTYKQSIEEFEKLIKNGFFIKNADIKNQQKK